METPGQRYVNGRTLEIIVTGSGRLDIFQRGGATHYVRDREKREVDFLITERRKPYALVEAKLSARDIDGSLSYFAERLKPQYAVQVVRNPEGFRTTMSTSGVIMTPAAEFLALIYLRLRFPPEYLLICHQQRLP